MTDSEIAMLVVGFVVLMVAIGVLSYFSYKEKVNNLIYEAQRLRDIREGNQ